MRDLDREIGLQRSDDGRTTEARRLGERLLYVDELEETIGAYRQMDAGDSDRLRAWEREAESARAEFRALETQGRIDYAEIGRAMRRPGQID